MSSGESDGYYSSMQIITEKNRKLEQENHTLRTLLYNFIDHDAEMRDNCGDWGTDSCDFRLRSERYLAQISGKK